jgi:hypothetical protein
LALFIGNRSHDHAAQQAVAEHEESVKEQILEGLIADKGNKYRKASEEARY